LYRSWLINRYLSSMQNITTDDMKKLQTSYYNLLAEKGLPVLLNNISYSRLDTTAINYLTTVSAWDLSNNSASVGATIFKLWVDSAISKIYGDELNQSGLPVPTVEPNTLITNIEKDSAKLFADDINTPEKETVENDITNAFLSIIPVLEKAKHDNVLEWGKFKDGGIVHLIKIPAFSRLHLNVGGGENIINAFEKDHGPSWRMIVELTDDINAYGVYPGGQSGNPGSKHYDDFVDTWASNKYYQIYLYNKQMIASQKNNLGKMVLSK